MLFPCPSTAECRAPHAPLQMGTAEGALGRGRCHRGLGPTRKREQRTHSTGRWCRGRDRRLVLDWAAGRGVGEGDVAAAVKQGWVRVLMCHMCVL